MHEIFFFRKLSTELSWRWFFFTARLDIKSWRELTKPLVYLFHTLHWFYPNAQANFCVTTSILYSRLDWKCWGKKMGSPIQLGRTKSIGTLLLIQRNCCNWRLNFSLTMSIFTVNLIPSEGDDFLRWWYHIFLALQSKHKDWLTVHATSWVEKTGKKEQETDYDKWRMIISWSRFSPSSTQLSRIKHSLLCSFSTQSIVEKYFLTAFLC